MWNDDVVSMTKWYSAYGKVLLLLAILFGRKFKEVDRGFELTGYRFRGHTFIKQVRNLNP